MSGANAAAADPGGMTQDEKTLVSGLLRSDEAKGAAVHAFNPDATPEEKAAAAGRAKAQLAALPGVRHAPEAAHAVVVDDSAKNATKADVTIEDLDRASRAEGQGAGEDAVPGAIPIDAAPPVPSWIQTGWKQVAQGESAKENILAAYMSEQMYGSWYHNAAIISFAVLTTRFITVLHFGWGWILLILASCASYYSLSISRTRQRARDDIQRELVKTRLVTETESADWLNQFLDRFWLIYEPVLSQTIVASVDAVLASSTPAFLESIRLTTFTLGTKAPRIDSVRTFPKTPEDIVIMDWAVSFTPNDLLDITPRQAQNRVNPKIVLSIRVGKGGISKSLPVLLEDMSFTGRMRVKLKLMTNFPHVQTIDMSFIEKPTFDYVLKPLGGETFGFDINNIPGLAPFIRDQVHANLGPMMYDPNVFTIDLQALLSGTPLDSAIGVLRVTIIEARGLKAVKLGGGAPDPYVSVALGARPAVTKTPTITSSHNPSWNDSQFILVNTLSDVLNLSIFDYNEHRPDNLLGTVSHELGGLNDDAEQQGLVGQIISGGKERGELRYDLSYFPVLQPAKNPDGTLEPLPESSTGVVRLTLHQAKDLDISRQHGDLNPFAKVLLGGKTIHKTPILKHANQPIWESHCEFLVPAKNASVITIQVIDSKDFASDPSLGHLNVKLTDLLEARVRQQDWLPLRGSRAGKIRLTAEWKPVAMSGSLSGASTYTPPIGILRLWLKSASDLKNVEAALGGKSDPYVRVIGQNKTLARTEVISNNLNPVWDQIVYVPVHSLRDNLMLEIMDYQNIGKDRSLGFVELKVNDCAEATSDLKYPYASRGRQVCNERVRLGKANTYKGNLLFEVDFKPAVALRGGVSFESLKELDTVEEHEAKEEEDAKGVTMSTEQLLASQAGILVLQVISGQLARRGSLEVMFDDGYWPCFTSTRARSSHQSWDQIGEGFIRELDFSRIWLRINAADDSEKEDVVAEYKSDTRDFLEQCIRQPTEYALCQPDGSNRSVIRLSARFVPVDIKLEPRESINNMGVLRVDVVGAQGLMAADRSGKSDPNVTFTLNGVKVFKSETKKKTLSPVWNESFEVMVPSRVAAKFGFEVADWDRVGSATPLGGNAIDLANLEPFESVEQRIPVLVKGAEHGSLTCRFLFQPEIIARSRQKTSTFSTAGRAITTIGGVPLGVGKGVIHGGTAVASGVGHGIGTVGGFAGRKIGLIKKKNGELVEEPLTNGIDDPAGETLDPPLPDMPGILNVTVLGATGIQSKDGSSAKSYIAVKMGARSHKTGHVKGLEPEWNESFAFSVSPGTSMLTAVLHEHHTLGKDPEFGQADVNIWQYLNSGSSAEVPVQLLPNGGTVRLRLDWTAGVATSVKSADKRNRAPSLHSKIDSPSRFSLRRDRSAA